MVLLKLENYKYDDDGNLDLHSNMVLLKSKGPTLLCFYDSKFTFQYGTT